MATGPVAVRLGGVPVTRTGYHHGDLPAALITCALTLARQDGPEAVVLRQVAARAGVSATAAYRHFAGAEGLIRAVQCRASDALTEAMVRAAAPVPGHDVLAALYRLAHGYVQFALSEPGLFRTAFCRSEGARRPYRLILAAVERVPGHREGAAILVYATTHGLATLLLDGPGCVPEGARTALIHHTLDAAVRSIVPPRDSLHTCTHG